MGKLPHELENFTIEHRLRILSSHILGTASADKLKYGIAFEKLSLSMQLNIRAELVRIRQKCLQSVAMINNLEEIINGVIPKVEYYDE